MLIEYIINATDLGSALSVAASRAHNDSYSHTSVQSTRQVGPREWAIVMFVANSQPLTQRRQPPGYSENVYGQHRCTAGCTHG